MDALDISNYTPAFNRAQCEEWHGEGVGLAIVQLVSGVRLAGDSCSRQIDICLEAGLAVDCYLFPGNDGLPLSGADRLALVSTPARPHIRQLWVDIESAGGRFATQHQINAYHAICDQWAPHQYTGDYSALWVAHAVGWLPWPWPERKQWLVYVRNDGAPNMGGTFAGTDNHQLTQYRMDVTLAGVSGMDRSCLSPAEEQAVMMWLGGPEKMAITVGAGMAAQMEAANDAPLCDHIYYQQTDDDGKTYDVERCQGAKGLYVSSNASGQWTNAGPI